MVDKSRKRKKGSISEEDVSTLLERYSVNTVLALLQEVAQVAGEKIDWHEMVKNTATGISGAREYQMLWRHLAYSETLIDQFDHDGGLMDDDSDLEYELEAFPAVGREASAEAAAFVKVLIASGYPNDTQLPNNSTIEAPLTINIPNSKALTNPSESSLLANAMAQISVYLFLYKNNHCLLEYVVKRGPTMAHQDLISLLVEKKKGWSTEEDMKLTAAVEKYGERNWANIARGDFKNDRKASELSQRWANLRKKQGNLKVGTSSQLSETQLAAAHRAMSLALNMPMGQFEGSFSNKYCSFLISKWCLDNVIAANFASASFCSLFPIDKFSYVNSLGKTSDVAIWTSLLNILIGMKSQHQSQKASTSPTDQQLARAGPPKSQLLLARIATSADASSLIEAARSQNVVHITTAGSSVMKSSTTSITNQLPSNVHFIRNGLAKAPISTYSAAKPNISRPGEAQQAQGHPIKPAASAVQSKPVVTATVLNVTSGVETATASTRSITLPKSSEDAVVSTSAAKVQELLQRDQDADQAAIPC
ncbi:UNVERIFIED_CONTAM: hypothetical protein Sradi_5622500 [Sesamum radiatum]|uniref:Uncharacterized protein n=1 Tax=Sesamum radiatum TaxID=300843 RepID=A0AAW2L1I1_SESRA